MPYTHFRYIAYEVPTATNRTDIPNPPVVAGLPPGDLCDAVPDMPVPKPVQGQPDWFVRLRRLAAVVNIAKLNLGADNASTLKVFVAPEFYFRPATPATHHTYTVEEYQNVWDGLDKIFHSPRFKDWLIVPGSILWHSETMDLGQTTYYNTVWHVRGGFATGEARRIEKRLASNLDGVPTARAVGAAPALKALYEDKEFTKERLFTVDAATVGLEICLDHGSTVKALKTAVRERHTDATDAWAGGPALHVLTAGGMPIVPASVAAKPNGYLLRNDGYANPPYSELRRVTGYRLQPSGTPSDECTAGSVADLAADPDDAAEVNLGGNAVLVPPPGPGNYDMPKQRLRIYPPKVLP